MWEVILVYSLVVAAFAYLVWRMKCAGLFESVTVSISDEPPFVNKSLTIFYKHHIGAYNRLGALYHETRSLMPTGATVFGIYYDNPQELKDYLLQSAVGVIFGEDGTDLYTQNYSEQLIRWGYERMVLPKVDRAVVAAQKFDGYFSLFTLLNFTYPKIMSFTAKSSADVRVIMELFRDNKVHIMIPLDHQTDFNIPQLLTVDELETKLARKKWDSDVESESCSDTEVDEGTATDAGANDDNEADGDKKNE